MRYDLTKTKKNTVTKTFREQILLTSETKTKTMAKTNTKANTKTFTFKERPLKIVAFEIFV